MDEELGTKTAPEDEKSTVTQEEVYQNIDGAVHKFVAEFLNILPASPDVGVHYTILVDKILSVKETAKLLVNTYAQGKAKAAAAEKAEEKAAETTEELLGKEPS